MAGEKILVTLEGGGPWGFRLFGGEDEPLVIAKLRKRSKASEAGLQEDDVLLTINGYSCKQISHARAMELVDNAAQILHMSVLRGTIDPESLVRAYHESENEITKVEPNGVKAYAAGLDSFSATCDVQGAPILDRSGLQVSNTSLEDSTTNIGGNNVHSESQEPMSGSEEQDTAAATAKERIRTPSTVPAFSVSKVAPDKKPGLWQPSLRQPQPKADSGGQNREYQQQMESQKSQVIRNSESEQNTPQQEDSKTPIKWMPPSHVTETDTDSMSDSSISGRPSDIEIKPIALSKLIKEGSGSDEPNTPESPSSWKKKRFYADSSFYNDPSGKYPTLDEQVKMARKVALSLTAPVNLDARGHKMFIKRKEKSKKWTSKEQKKAQQYQEESDEPQQEPYYNPDPWHQQGKLKTPSSTDNIASWEPLAPAEADLKLWRAPVIPGKESQKNALSADEFERMRLYEEKNLHGNVSPQACFDLAQALKHANGKSGKMFQKRKQRMEKYTTDESNVKHAPPTPIASQEKHYAKLGPPTNRLQEMIHMPKPKMSPWEAALEDEQGNVDAAFEHLRRYEAKKLSSLTPAGEWNSDAPHKTDIQVGPAVPPQGSNRTAKPWAGSAIAGLKGRGVSDSQRHGEDYCGWKPENASTTPTIAPKPTSFTRVHSSPQATSSSAGNNCRPGSLLNLQRVTGMNVNQPTVVCDM